MDKPKVPKVLVVGGGFGGIAAAKALAGAPVEVIVVDRRNHHVFAPLLYQVATAALSPADICSPIRSILRRQKNCQVVLAEVLKVDIAQKRLIFKEGYAEYDYLILAAGASHAYFGHDEWAAVAPGLKRLEDATLLRQRILLAFESAEYEASEEARRARLTFGIVGGGPTGVELAGAIKEVAGLSIPSDFRNIDTRTTRVILFHSGERILPQFPPASSERATRDLQKMGVEIRLNAKVTDVNENGISIGDENIPLRNVFWAAGVSASGLGKDLGVALDRSGRVIVGVDLCIEGHPEVFVIGDMAAAKMHADGKPVPGVAQGALQMGRYAGKTISLEVSGQASQRARQPFSFWDKGSMAVIGKSRAVVSAGKFHIGGFIGWSAWAMIHFLYLDGLRNRFNVLAEWIWSIFFNARHSRLIVGDAHLEIHTPRTADFVSTDPVQS